MKYVVMIVLYNKKIEDSTTYLSIKKYFSNFEFIFFDNSTSDYKNEEFCKKNKLMYLTKNKNVGLSKAYNLLNEYAKDLDYEYRIIFDDDSCVDENYYKQLEKNSKNGYEILVPYIVNKKGEIQCPMPNETINPIKYINHKLTPLTKERIKKLELKNKLTTINSGMVIKKSVQYIYDERIFLDCVDWKFCEDMQKKKIQITVFDACLVQDFHYEDPQKEISKAKHERIIIRKKDLWAYSKYKYIFYLTILIAMNIRSTKNFEYLKYYFINK